MHQRKAEPAMHTAAGTRIPLLTIEEAAAYLRLTEKAVRRRVERARQDPLHYWFPYRKLGSSIRFMQSELDTWMVLERRERLRSA